ncbi:MAG TPA: sigma-54-dependent Fis family transcriptional regulator [Candidatus Binataceae bacterium]|nr:sigma-54-dependent Fis family transcriptional regulator [Candidatus Binataceae bacterium]
MIHELANSFAQRVDLDELIPFVVERCREILPASGVSLLLLEEQNNELTFAYVSEGDAEAGRRLIGMRIPADRGVAGAVLNKRCAELVVNVRDDSRHNSDVDRATGTSTGSLLAVPLIRGEHRLGVIEAVRRDGEPHFTPSDMSMLEVLGRTIAIALENAGRFGEIKASAEKLRVEVGALRRELARHDRFSEIIASSEAMSEVFNLMEAAAASSIPVLIEGETGTGKELAARAIHRTSDRADRPFVALNCAAVPEGLMESELFGHRRGAFTGALEDRHGLFRAASGGVLFLDEIGEMPAQMQAKLLRVLQEGEVTSVGDTRSHKVDVRVISATNVDLKAALEARAFREDLYYRLAAFTIRLPSLRERREDIEPLAVLTLDQAAQHHRKRIAGFAPEVIELFNNARWPGNVRQLQNEIERAVAVAREGDTVGLGHLSPQLMAACRLPASAVEAPVAVRLTPEVATASPKTLAEACSAFERSYIAETLERHNHNVSRASAALAISRVTLQKKMKEYSLRRPGA